MSASRDFELRGEYRTKNAMAMQNIPAAGTPPMLAGRRCQ